MTTTNATSFPAATISGYPRIGPNRELKKALEAHWAGQIGADEFADQVAEIRANRARHLASLGLQAPASLPADFVLYDQVLSTTCALGAVPERFRDLVGPTGAPDAVGEFTIARGIGEKPALEMTKWFDTNYHYLVPEIGPDTPIKAAANPWLDQVKSAPEPEATRPVIVGPLTWLLLSKPALDAPDYRPLDRLDDTLAAYEEVLAQLATAGVTWVQLDEPALVCDTWSTPRAEVLTLASSSYARLAGASNRPALFVNAGYGDLGSDGCEALAATGIEALGLDLVSGSVPDAAALTACEGRTLVAGVVSGRNIWRTDLSHAMAQLEALQAAAPGAKIAVSTSTSLQHVPHDASRETEIDPEIRAWLAFADQKVAEVQILARGLAEGRDAIETELAKNREILAARASHPGVNRAEVRSATAAITAKDRSRVPYEHQAAAQASRLDLPLLPTTTIGSFPQTSEIRKARAAFRAGALLAEEYDEAMRAEIRHVVELQEQLGLDVLVHGEAERNDMVQYFAEQLDGFTTTIHGWVQSYGSRCTRPSILWGDVSRPEPMTVPWSAFAASCTDRPMKGMLTGPVTIMAWSFVRDDAAKNEVADQIGLALRAEVGDLEAAGIPIIQVDEPAIRELLPLRAAERPDYLTWSVGAFRLATSGVSPTTQIHTHLCYSEFTVVVDAIDNLDADVTSIEASRSKMDILPAVAEHGFSRQLGPGIWDIHSPRIPTLEEETALLRAATAALDPRQLWVNPDCGLKTRAYPETIATLRNLVAAAKEVRAQVSS